jgi:hypothetical protein
MDQLFSTSYQLNDDGYTVPNHLSLSGRSQGFTQGLLRQPSRGRREEGEEHKGRPQGVEDVLPSQH